MNGADVDWEFVHFLAFRYLEHIGGDCDEKKYAGKEHGTTICYRNGKFIDDRCEHQVNLANGIAEKVFPYLESVAWRLLRHSFKMPTPRGPKFLGIRQGNSINTVEDLVQEGSIGVIRALKNYKLQKKGETTSWEDHAKRFVTYNSAAVMIRSAHNNTLIRIPVYLWHQSRSVLQDSSERRAALGLMEESGIVDDGYSSQGSYDGMRQSIIRNVIGSNFVNIDAPPFKNPRDGKNKGTWQERYLADTSSYADVEEQLIRELQEQKIREVLDALPEREREVIKLRFGFYGKELTLEQIGELYDLSRERIRQIEAKAINRLKRPSRARELIYHY